MMLVVLLMEHEKLCCFHGNVTLSVHQICSYSKVVDKFIPQESHSFLNTRVYLFLWQNSAGVKYALPFATIQHQKTRTVEHQS